MHKPANLIFMAYAVRGEFSSDNKIYLLTVRLTQIEQTPGKHIIVKRLLGIPLIWDIDKLGIVSSVA